MRVLGQPRTVARGLSSCGKPKLTVDVKHLAGSKFVVASAVARNPARDQQRQVNKGRPQIVLYVPL